MQYFYTSSEFTYIRSEIRFNYYTLKSVFAAVHHEGDDHERRYSVRGIGSVNAIGGIETHHEGHEGHEGEDHGSEDSHSIRDIRPINGESPTHGHHHPRYLLQTETSFRHHLPPDIEDSVKTFASVAHTITCYKRIPFLDIC